MKYFWSIKKNNSFFFKINFRSSITQAAIILIVFLPFSTLAQCPTLSNGQLVLSTQQEVNDFIQDYPNCSVINGDFYINGTVTDVSGLSFIIEVTGNFHIFNSDLVEISGFNNLVAVGERFSIGHNELLQSITGFNGLITIFHIAILDNTVESIDGFNALETVTDHLFISQNYNLISIVGFNKLSRITGVFAFNYNTNLKIIPSFENLTSIGKQLQFLKTGLVEISGFNNLTSIGLDELGGLNFQFMPVLERITGFNNLTEISQQLLIRYNDVIYDISGIRNLERVGKFFDISENPMLASLEGLNSLVEVSDGSILNAFVLTKNPLLFDCSIICPLLISNGVNGTIVISDNLMGCNSEDQVINGCLDDAYIIPNFFTPNNDGINDTWLLIGVVNQNYVISIFDRFGKILKQLNPSEPSWNGYYNGVQMPSTDYWFRLVFEDGTIEKGHFSLVRR